jgi:hypothetical protein
VVLHCYKNWRKITPAASGAADQTSWVMENYFDICDGNLRIFQHFRWKFSTVSEFSEYIPFPIDGNFRCFEIFRFDSLFNRCKFPTISKFSDYNPGSIDGSSRRFEIFRFYFFSKDGIPPCFSLPIMVIPDCYKVFR